MTVNRPGLPGDLPSAEVLWARWALVAVLEATTADERAGCHRTGTWVDDEGLHLDDAGCTWWAFAQRGAGRYVLYGEDESSQVKWHEPPVDMLAGAPHGSRTSGCGTCWRAANSAASTGTRTAPGPGPYPSTLKDDGLDCGVSRFVDRTDVLQVIADEDHGALPAHDAATLLDHAESYRLTQDLLFSLATGPDRRAPERPAMVRAWERAGLQRP
ncbi:hypothetical protein QA860_37835 [Streptomyces stelliscabiei]|uniref:hypothetical protein n=1 Tax=Streptomyces stelliscabiei TaxID=146820 RepID=UPI002FF068E5